MAHEVVEFRDRVKAFAARSLYLLSGIGRDPRSLNDQAESAVEEVVQKIEALKVLGVLNNAHFNFNMSGPAVEVVFSDLSKLNSLLTLAIKVLERPGPSLIASATSVGLKSVFEDIRAELLQLLRTQDAVLGSIDPLSEKISEVDKLREALSQAESVKVKQAEILSLQGQLEYRAEELDKKYVKLADNIELLDAKATGHLKGVDGELVVLSANIEAAEQKVRQQGDDVAVFIRDAVDPANKIIEELKVKQIEANKAVGRISETVMAGSFKANALWERVGAEVTRVLSLCLMGGILYLNAKSLIEHEAGTFEWKVVVYRLIFTLAMSVPAVYLARESTKHRLLQNIYTRIYLNILTISPFIASLPEDQQHKIKIDMVEKFFIVDDPTDRKKDSYPIDIQEMLQIILAKGQESIKNSVEAPTSKPNGSA